ncbi:MAG: tetratricopeptide repeat protein [Anaerolineales bacterium]|nr:tetratricopeptide repeat protein [Anaerolineales bacterium]
MERSVFLAAVDAALSLSAASSAATGAAYAKRACLEWLARWPGDFRVRARLADACLRTGETDQAVQHLRQVIEADPESGKAYGTLSALLRRTGCSALSAEVDGCLFALGAAVSTAAGLPDWADPLQTSLRLLKDGRWQEARLSAETVLCAGADQALPALVHLQTLWRLSEHAVVLSAGGEYRTRWPGCAAFLLLMAQSCFSTGRNAQGVELLHAVSVADPASEVADRYLGALNPYRSLWPAQMTAELSTALPAEVAAAAGWNRLASGPPGPEPPDLPADIPVLRFPDFDAENPPPLSPSGPVVIEPIPGELFPGPFDSSDEKTSGPYNHAGAVRQPEPPAPKTQTTTPTARREDSGLDDLRRELDRVAGRLRVRKGTRKKDSRQPAYLILTSRKRLTAIYGAGALPQIDDRLQSILRSKRGMGGWSAYLADVDDSENLKAFGLSPVDPANAWQVKTLISGICAFLEEKSEMLGALLIVGGEEVIPFHRLPNPADDDDADVPSDNPYAARDENYFVPEWPVGRIPTPPDSKAVFLLETLGRIAERESAARKTVIESLWWVIRTLLRPGTARFRKGSACTAAVWKRASGNVFRPVSSTASLLVAPPIHSGTLPKEFLARPKYSYFNLHGLERGPQWLGQRESSGKGPADAEFPIVLNPSQVVEAGNVPQVVFTEACYGANIRGKGVRDALSIAFLGAGTRALVGSTKICYGAAAAPLIAADLLAHLFLQNCLSGVPAGESLRLAKLAFTEEMNRRQGFLDPEDQKTLISFILLGDPLYASETGSAKRGQRGIPRRRFSPERIKTIFAKEDFVENGSSPSPKVQLELKKAMAHYLPGMGDSRIRFLHPQEGQGVPSGEAKDASPGRKPQSTPRSPAWVVALDRKSEAHGQAIRQFAKISLDGSGRVVKIAVSR